jgi:large conductance mechanosensitive channel
VGDLGKKATRRKKKPATTKKCPYCISEISVQATRCPFCTSSLESTEKGSGNHTETGEGSA